MKNRHELINAIAIAAHMTTKEATQALDTFENAMNEVSIYCDELPDIPDLDCGYALDDNVQHWRGGTRKKGGKIGYRRN